MITFVIPSRNNLEFLKLCIPSIKRLGGEHHMIVLDDASSDGTSEWLDSLQDRHIQVYRNDGPERQGIVRMFDKGIALAKTDIILAFHADMVAAPNLDTNILKHLKRGCVVSATRIEPPLHPEGPEKIIRDFGDEVDSFNLESFEQFAIHTAQQYDGHMTTGVFAPWCMYKDDFFAVGGHDLLFAPQSKEDSDLFNRFHLNQYSLIQAWDALVYHFTSRGSRYNTHSGGAAGKDSPEWQLTNHKNTRNFIRKWGHSILHDAHLCPIVHPRHSVEIRLTHPNANIELLHQIEPFADQILLKNIAIKDLYIRDEQENTLINLDQKLNLIHDEGPSIQADIVLEIPYKEALSSERLARLTHLAQVLNQADLAPGEYRYSHKGIKKRSGVAHLISVLLPNLSRLADRLLTRWHLSVVNVATYSDRLKCNGSFQSIFKTETV